VFDYRYKFTIGVWILQFHLTFIRVLKFALVFGGEGVLK